MTGASRRLQKSRGHGIGFPFCGENEIRRRTPQSSEIQNILYAQDPKPKWGGFSILVRNMLYFIEVVVPYDTFKARVPAP